jgi:peptidoglycan/xylan/chitin deacetylase (PgdA/CDA1 family)
MAGRWGVRWAVLAGSLWLLAAQAVAQGDTVARAQTAGPAFAWPGGARLAVSLGYDDALASQLDTAVPALNARGLRASFYLTLASDTVSRRLADWRAVAARGHELGNHTLFHPCSRSAAPGRDWVAPHRDLDRLPAAALREEILLANAFLAAIDGQPHRSFTAPCGDPLAAGQPYLPALREAFVAVKSRPGSGLTLDITAQDPMDLPTLVPVGISGEALVDLVRRAAAESRGRALLSITFHGIGAEHLSVSVAAHEALLDHLKAHPQDYWVDSFVNLMRWVRRP